MTPPAALISPIPSVPSEPRQSGLRRKPLEELAERLQPAGECTHGDDRKRVRERLVHGASTAGVSVPFRDESLGQRCNGGDKFRWIDWLREMDLKPRS